MIKILAIGNSFSQDATTFLHDIARGGNIETKVVNLYIGGCSLQTHWENVENDAAAYQYQLNGIVTDRVVSIKAALEEDAWDFVTIQQCSPLSGIAGSYYPYITRLADYVREIRPAANRFIHQTWAYETDSGHEGFASYRNNQKTMYKALVSAYKKATKTLGLPLIPCGNVIQKLRGEKLFNYAKGGQSLCRDGFHLHLSYGRYAAAAVWYEILLKGSILENDFLPLVSGGEVMDIERAALIRRIVHKVCGK